VAYLVLIIVVALVGIAKITLQQRREHKLHIQNDYRTSLEKVATQPLASSRADDGPRRRWELAGFSERRKAREERTEMSHREEPRSERKTRSEERAAPRRKDSRPAAKRPAERAVSRNKPDERSRRRKQTRAPKNERLRKHRARVRTNAYEEEIDWFEDLRSQPSDISLDHDLAPTRLPVNTRRAGQPSTRGRLQTQVHANIHPAHLPPGADIDVDIRSPRIHASA
jgi:hypothetical protein